MTRAIEVTSTVESTGKTSKDALKVETAAGTNVKAGNLATTEQTADDTTKVEAAANTTLSTCTTKETSTEATTKATTEETSKV